MGHASASRDGNLPVHQRLLQSASAALNIGLEKPRRLRTKSGLNEHRGRNGNATGPDLHRLDEEYAERGIRSHARPMRAALNLFGPNFQLGCGSDGEADAIIAAYGRLFPDGVSDWPGAGIGLAASVDRVRKLTVPVVLGQCRLEPWEVGFGSVEEWWEWCRKRHDIAFAYSFAWADTVDIAYGLNELGETSAPGQPFWTLATSNLEDIVNALPASSSVDTLVQPIHLVIELAIKGYLVANGASPNSFYGKEGHKIQALANRVIKARPHRDDDLVRNVVDTMPRYTSSRYKPEGFMRLRVVQLALGSQFVAASCLRRLTSRDIGGDVERYANLTSRPIMFS